MTADVAIRNAHAEDLPRLTEIYNTYVRNSHATFDVDEFTVDQRRSWFNHYANRGPHQLLVADDGGRILGYASSSPFRDKPAYGNTVETTIYLGSNASGHGLGTELYAELFRRLEDHDVHRAVAAIAVPNAASVALHRRHGFVAIGTLTEVGRKFDRWIDVQWFERRR